MAASDGVGNGAVVVVFDFDKTIIDCDSDNWVVDALGATGRFDELLRRLPWNSAIDAMMGELHAEGRTVEEVAACLRAAPLSPRVAAAVETAHALGCELRVLSDANAFFVGAVLEHHGLAGYFSAVDTNPAFVDGDGRLRILPYHDFHAPAAGHGCTLPTCPPNMCKGKVMERIVDEISCGGGGGKPAARRRRVVYLGDGRGDYCPSLKLTERDYVMPRKGYPVWDLIAGDRDAVRGDVREWADFDDLEAVLLGIVAECLTSEQEEDDDDDDGEAAPAPAPADQCRALQPTLASGQDQAILPKAVHVPN
ncbi:inorganic pyrophosphatase 2-like [Oryza brachyantha]|uniref:inorganic pyrophosphatase 2-like n=1 Tax=Oryza brachyantha TaxID=4533 RepID=UPI001ADAD0A4|nr:inorganic pyrophosphatase 2-like [Oryza brachyantha]